MLYFSHLLQYIFLILCFFSFSTLYCGCVSPCATDFLIVYYHFLFFFSNLAHSSHNYCAMLVLILSQRFSHIALYFFLCIVPWGFLTLCRGFFRSEQPSTRCFSCWGRRSRRRHTQRVHTHRPHVLHTATHVMCNTHCNTCDVYTHCNTHDV